MRIRPTTDHVRILKELQPANRIGTGQLITEIQRTEVMVSAGRGAVVHEPHIPLVALVHGWFGKRVAQAKFQFAAVVEHA